MNHFYKILFSLLVVLQLINQQNISGQLIYFFSNGTSSAYYDQGVLDVSNLGESTFEHTSPPGYPQWNDKIPCSPVAYKGQSSLKFNYSSALNGNWKVCIYRNDWTFCDITSKDSILFYVFSDIELPNSALPLIGIKSLNTSKTADLDSKLYPLSDYNGVVKASTWTKIKFPIARIMNDPDNRNMDFKSVKAIVFNQSETNNSQRTFLVDELIAFKSISNIPDVVNFTAKGYDSHSELNWTIADSELSYRIWASYDNGQTFETRGETNTDFYLDFVPENARNSGIIYRIEAFLLDKKSAQVQASALLTTFSDSELLDMVQRYTFRYFWEGAHQPSGMIFERSNGTNNAVASGASGMGLMTLIVAYEREFQDRSLIKNRILNILGFLEACDRYHGAWSHWYNADTYKTIPFSVKDDGGDLVETAYVAAGLIALRNYFTETDLQSSSIRNKASNLLNSIEWNWYRQGGQNVLYWHWSPACNFEINMPVNGWDEALITYIMAASSSGYGIPKVVYDQGWAKSGNMVNKRSFYNYEISLSPDWGGPLFWTQYSFLGINPYGLKDQYADYWKENQNTSRIQYAYSVANPGGHLNYSSKCWGLTASDDPNGYSAHQPVKNDNGTISPTAALSSIPYTPEESLRALKYFYRERGKDIFGKYGFIDAFNDDLNWKQNAWIGIDQGPILIMIENYRTGLLWNTVMKDADVRTALNNLGFTYETISSNDEIPNQCKLKIEPNPSNGNIILRTEEFKNGEHLHFKVFSMEGQELVSKTILCSGSGTNVNLLGLGSGFYIAYLTSETGIYSTKLIIQK